MQVIKISQAHFYMIDFNIDFPTGKLGSYDLPQWFFYQSKVKTSFVSPSAVFNPVTALDGEPWQTITTPVQPVQLKRCVLDQSIFQYGLNESDVIAQIDWLKLQGIKVYLCVSKEEGNQFISCDKQNDFEKYISELGRFNPDDDYERMATQQQLERDKTVVLDRKKSKQLISCLHATKRYEIPLKTNTPQSKSTYYRHIDVNSYSAYIPFVEANNEDFSIGTDSGYLKLTNYKCHTLEELSSTLKKAPHDALQILEENKNLITKDNENKLRKMNNEILEILTPFCFRLLGLNDDPLFSISYFTDLKGIISIYDIPLENLHNVMRDGYDKVIANFPDIELRFNELLSNESISLTYLVITFPQRAFEILEKRKAIYLYDLRDALSALPEESESLIDMNLDLIKTSIQKSFIEDKARKDAIYSQKDLLGIIKKSKKHKFELLALIKDHITLSNIHLYVLANPPDVKTFLKDHLPAYGLNAEIWIEIVTADPNLLDFMMAEYPIDMRQIKLTKINDKTLLKQLYLSNKTLENNTEDKVWLLQTNKTLVINTEDILWLLQRDCR